jgi:hypothetical protein
MRDPTGVHRIQGQFLLENHTRATFNVITCYYFWFQELPVQVGSDDSADLFCRSAVPLSGLCRQDDYLGSTSRLRRPFLSAQYFCESAQIKEFAARASRR